MAKRPTLTDVTSGFGTAAVINGNNAAIETAFDNTLSRDGSSPNQMEANIDMNSNRILNLPDAINATEAVNLQQARDLVSLSIKLKKENQTATAGQTVFTASTMFWNTAAGYDNLMVFVNGVMQGPSTYTVNSTTQITFSTGLDAGDRVDLVAI